MAHTTLAERLAELLELPVEVIRAYGKPRTSVAFRRVRKPGAIIDTGHPSSRLMTLKDTEPQPASIEAEEITPTKTDENELYAQWRDASEEEKPQLTERLFNTVLKHTRAVIWQTLHESDPGLEDLARDITSDAIKNLSMGRFDERSKFSTYVHAIARNKINEELERRIISRERFYVSDENLEDDINLKDAKAESAFAKVVQAVDLERIDRLAKELPRDDYLVYQCWRDSMTMKATAEKLGIPEDTAENRLRRNVKPYLKKKILAGT